MRSYYLMFYFIQDGEKVMTGRIYPQLQSEAIEIFSEGEVELVELVKWKLKSAID
jgi:beta-fructofuranosidase